MYDGIVIGGGHNGLTCAAYLAKTGLKIAVVEGSEKIGGGLSTEEVTLPGFKHNLHGNFHSYIRGVPVISDLELERFGAKYIFPPVVRGMAFRDKKALTFHSDINKTIKSVERFSRKDALTIRRLYDFLNKTCASFLLSSFFSPPLDIDEKNRRLRKIGAEELIHINQLTSKQVVEEYFESEYVRVFFLHAITTLGVTDIPGSGGFFPATLTRHPNTAMCASGAVNLATALANVVKANGGEVLTNSLVTRILVKDGEARGVELADGKILEARRFVASGVNIKQTMRISGEEHFDEDIVQKIKNWKWETTCLVSLHLALRQPPKFLAADFDPDMNNVWVYFFGTDTVDELTKSFRQLERGELPDNPSGNGACNSMFDPTLAPEGKHVAFWWPYSTYHLQGKGPEAWDEMRDQYSEVLLNVWKEFAPNISADNILGKYLLTPLDIERTQLSMPQGAQFEGAFTVDQLGRNRPHKSMASYRTPISGLYLCSSSNHPGGGITFAPGYNAANIIAEDLSIDKWWKPLTLQNE